jgi:hypothetical protein
MRQAQGIMEAQISVLQMAMQSGLSLELFLLVRMLLLQKMLKLVV